MLTTGCAAGAGRRLPVRRITQFGGSGVFFLLSGALLISAPAQAQWYPDRLEYPVPMTPQRIATGSINADGFPDVVVGARTGQLSKAYVYLNDADGTFTLGSEIPVASGWLSACVGDYNGDGFGDIVASGDPTKVHYQTLGGAFTTGQALTIPGFDKALAMTRSADFDGDGFEDLIGCKPGSPAEGRLLVYWGGPSGLILTPEILVVDLVDDHPECWTGDYNTGILKLGLGDVDQDGDIDVWFPADYEWGEACYGHVRGLGWYENVGERDFAGVHWILREPMDHWYAEYIDAGLGFIDSDPYIDWLLYDADIDHSVWLRGSTQGAWAPPTLLMDEEGSPELSDLDQDGDDDLILLGEPGIRVFESEGDAIFEELDTVWATHHWPIVEDLNGDNRADVVSISASTNEFWVFMNNSSATTSVPMAESRSSARLIAHPSVASGDAVELRLDASPSDPGGTLSVFNSGGQLVRRGIANGAGPNGAVWRWDLRDDVGRDVGTGVYWARVSNLGVSARVVVILDD